MNNYWVLIIGLMLLSSLAQTWLRNTYARFSTIRNARNLTGAEVARDILDRNGLQNIRIEKVAGTLSDHYDPIQKVVRLSANNYDQPSLAALAVAAHEVGHAIQDKTHFGPLSLRHQLSPVLSVSANFGQIAIMIGLMMSLSGLGKIFFMVGLAGMAATLLFHLVTLPVEFDASNRALKILEQNEYLSPQENQGARSVLTAAASTYVVATVGALATLMYYLGFLRRQDD